MVKNVRILSYTRIYDTYATYKHRVPIMKYITLPVSNYAVICFQTKTKQFWSAKSRHMRRRTFDGKAHVANAKTW